MKCCVLVQKAKRGTSSIPDRSVRSDGSTWQSVCNYVRQGGTCVSIRTKGPTLLQGLVQFLIQGKLFAPVSRPSNVIPPGMSILVLGLEVGSTFLVMLYELRTMTASQDRSAEEF
ncbi:hypothetical protein SNOG_07836 [Parastagonospora nodorum SN15]|uniref:Uncharacterized protein n=1 Tax=Phaeosphaeria nodorum (strain SN15 / ATCC MYA-4574 / FGSC 10173) TaxID=321614 RepID=Q0UK78_PHANO|nr:hypothetical protein SNOG_07836 [Parastagonospora nodorum SN15]EAT85302.1 hypothetical protein SNOG_07836 [Parastagonospora nodorum SN15]